MTLYVGPAILIEPEAELTGCVECRVMMHSTVSDLSVLYSCLEACIISGFSKAGEKVQSF